MTAWTGNGWTPPEPPDHGFVPFAVSGYGVVCAKCGRRRQAHAVEIPSGLCSEHGCVFLYGHRGLHSWAKPRGKLRL